MIAPFGSNVSADPTRDGENDVLKHVNLVRILMWRDLSAIPSPGARRCRRRADTSLTAR